MAGRSPTWQGAAGRASPGIARPGSPDLSGEDAGAVAAAVGDAIEPEAFEADLRAVMRARNDSDALLAFENGSAIVALSAVVEATLAPTTADTLEPTAAPAAPTAGALPTAAPTTFAPATAAPTTFAPTTVAPATVAPTTFAPTPPVADAAAAGPPPLVRALTSWPALAAAAAGLLAVAAAGARRRRRGRRARAAVAPRDKYEAPRGTFEEPQLRGRVLEYPARVAVAPREGAAAPLAAEDDFDDVFSVREESPCEETAVVPLAEGDCSRDAGSDWDSDDDDDENPRNPLVRRATRAASLTLGRDGGSRGYRRLATL